MFRKIILGAAVCGMTAAAALAQPLVSVGPTPPPSGPGDGVLHGVLVRVGPSSTGAPAVQVNGGTTVPAQAQVGDSTPTSGVQVYARPTYGSTTPAGAPSGAVAQAGTTSPDTRSQTVQVGQ